MGISTGPRASNDGLVFYIDLGNKRSYSGAGITIYDLVTGGIAGTIINGPTYDVANNGGISFDGTNDYALFGRRADLQGTNITLSTWVKTYNLSSSDGTPYFGWTDGTNWQYGLTITSFGGLLLGYATTDARMAINNASLNKWYHLAVTSIGNSNNFYVNGIGVSSITASLGFAATNLLVSGWGGPGYVSYGRYTLGSAKIHNRALSAAEINQEYYSTKKRYYPDENYVTNGLYIDLDASNPASYPGTGNSWFDLSGSGNHFSLLGTFQQKKTGVLKLTATQHAYRNAGWGTNIHTIDMYFRGKSGYGAYNRFLSTGPSDNFEVAVNEIGVLRFYPNWSDTNVRLNYSKFNHLVISRNFTELKFYLNGSLIQTTSTGATPGGSIFLGTRYPLNEYTEIELGSFKVYDRILSLQEVQQNYNALRPRYAPYEAVTDKLIFNVDFGESSSWVGSGFVNDISGFGNTGTALNGPTNAYLDSYTSFDGTNDYVSFNYDSLDLGTSNFSVSVWFKTSASQAQSLVANQINNGWNGFNFGIYSGYLTPTVDWGNSQQYGALQSVSTYSDNTWREATFVFNGATVSNWKLYINGVQVSAIIEGGSVSTISGSGISNNIPLTIGYRSAGSYFSGQIGRVLIYKKALSDSEIAQNFNSIRDRYNV
jgi:hypothetical protein